ncbi:MAG: hypothetical protein C0622_00800 [Desulfuromonas sp.]|nr:MAG: hypothetical protein C0622_00800 [Desulfuromonas sp.]
MNCFVLRIRGATGSDEFPGIISFVGEDASGSFGIRANCARLMTSLVFGLARFRSADKHWSYLALPGALLYFNDNILTLSTRRYLIDDDYMRVSRSLQQQLLAEEEKLRSMKESLQQMEEEVLKHLWEIGRKGAI